MEKVHYYQAGFLSGWKEESSLTIERMVELLSQFCHPQYVKGFQNGYLAKAYYVKETAKYAET